MPDPILPGDNQELPPGQLDPESYAESSSALDNFFASKAAAATPAAPPPEEKPAEPAEPAPAADPLDDLETKPAETPPEAKPAEVKPDDEPAPKHLNKEQAANWKTLRSEAKAANEAKAAAEARVAELEAKLAEKADPEEVKTLRKTVEELEDKLAFFAIQESPAFRAEFDDKITTENEAVYQALAAAGVAKDRLDEYRNADAVTTQSLKFWDSISTKLKSDPKLEGQALKLEAAVRNARRLQTEKAEALKDPAKLKAFGSKAAQAAVAKAAEDEKFLAEFVAQAQASHAWAKPIEVKPNAKPDEIAAAKAHNERHEKYKSVFVKAIESDDVRVRAKIGMAAIQALELQSENKRLQEQVAQRDAELSKLKGASPKAQKDSVAPSTKPAGTKGDGLPDLDFTDDSREALEARFNKFSNTSRK